MLKISKDEKRELLVVLYGAIGAFIGTLLAFGWTNVVNQILEYINSDLELPLLAIFFSFVYAFVITFFSIVFLVYIKTFTKAYFVFGKSGKRRFKKSRRPRF